jgi:hypothetical protein
MALRRWSAKRLSDFIYRSQLTMTDVLIITHSPIPKKLHGVNNGYGIRPISEREIVAIEDRFFGQGDDRKIRKGSTVAIFPDVAANAANIDEYTTIAAFSLSLLAVAGYVAASVAALFSSEVCTHAQYLGRPPASPTEAAFPSALTGKAAAQWLQRCSLAHKKLGDRVHITADRYVRYARADKAPDGIMDLCISLESLLDSQTEV